MSAFQCPNLTWEQTAHFMFQLDWFFFRLSIPSGMNSTLIPRRSNSFPRPNIRLSA